jgi:hypothetical protein
MTNADNASAFSIDIQRLVAGLTADAVVKATQKLALDALRRLILKSPVGFPRNWKNPAPKGYVGGQFRGSWQLTVGSEGSGIVGQPLKGKFGSTSAANVAASNAVAELDKLQPYFPVFIVNGLPYAQRLENGWSKQAPLGMVALTVQELQFVVMGYENGQLK